ncbi:MAG: hypothetical protein H7039_05940, partial [Bryobacteraceae bacterium]|nr:hypothetical protein [Bryobacteraceae bacterium]
MDFSRARRTFLFAAAGGWSRAADRSSAPSEQQRLRDPATEFEVIRLTDPSRHTAVFPAAPLRAVARNNTLIYCSDRSGSMQVWRMDLKSGESRQLTDVSSLNPSCVSLTQNERSLCYVDGERLVVQSGTRIQAPYAVETGWQAAGGFALSDDGLTASLVEKRNERFRLRLLAVRTGGGARTIYEADQPVRFCRFRPKRSSLLYNYNGVLTLVNFDGRGSRRLAITGSAGFALWSADGRAVQYLSIPEGRASIQLREHLPETGEDQLIGGTTQFVSF